jgi:hypothetical protein
MPWGWMSGLEARGQARRPNATGPRMGQDYRMRRVSKTPNGYAQARANAGKCGDVGDMRSRSEIAGVAAYPHCCPNRGRTAMTIGRSDG